MNLSNLTPVLATNGQEFLTAREVSHRLRLPLSTVYYLAKTGVLPAAHIGRTWRFLADAVAKFAGHKPAPSRVLVVDDDEVTRVLVQGVLESRGHLVVEAADAEAGLLAARQQRFDWLLIDFKLPGKDGVSLIQELQNEYSLGQMIMITAFVDLVDLEKLFGFGAVTLLRKPLEAAQLIECVERRLSYEGGSSQGLEKGAGLGLQTMLNPK
ncbi:MAG: response regulator [Verrucomicrobiota bacterium]|jgi:excisionase family DNA binding protein